MSEKPTHDILIAEDWEAGDGESKTAWTNVGAAWTLKNGGLSGKLRSGLALTGRFIIQPKKDPES